MTKTANKALVVATLLSFVALPALSRDNTREDDNDHGQSYHGKRDAPARDAEYYRHGDHVSAPEIDPAQALGALALLGGTVAIIRGYRRKNK
jgi:hypothetical protein